MVSMGMSAEEQDHANVRTGTYSSNRDPGRQKKSWIRRCAGEIENPRSDICN